MTQTEVLKLALEALELSSPAQVGQSKEQYEAECSAHYTALRAVRDALAQQEQELSGLPMVISGAIYDFAGYLTTRDKVIEVGSTANASPIVDLVKAWAELRGLSLDDAAVLSWQEWLANVPAGDTSQERVDETAKNRHEQEPFCWAQCTMAGLYVSNEPDEDYTMPLYTTPPQRTWVGLTDEEIGDEFVRFELPGGFNRFEYAVRAIEAKLKEKNT